MDRPEPPEDLDGQPELLGGTLARQRLPQPSLELALGLSDEPLMLLEEHPQPRVVVFPEEVRHHKDAGRPTAEQIVGQQGPGASCAPDRLRWCFASRARTQPHACLRSAAATG